MTTAAHEHLRRDGRPILSPDDGDCHVCAALELTADRFLAKVRAGDRQLLEAINGMLASFDAYRKATDIVLMLGAPDEWAALESAALTLGLVASLTFGKEGDKE